MYLYKKNKEKQKVWGIERHTDPSSLADDTTVYTESPKDPTDKLLEFVAEEKNQLPETKSKILKKHL